MKNITAFLLLIFPLFISGQSFDQDKMNALFDEIAKADKGMGSISLSYRGKQVYTRSIGYASIEDKVEAVPDMKYRIGSISKSFTSAVILQLVDEEKLSLSTSLSSYFPQLPNADSITVEHLLRHRSGLFNFTNDPAYGEYYTQEKSRDQLIEIMFQNDPIFNPGEQAEYSNTNFVLLSFIAEEVDGKSFAQILKDRIFDPLELSNTYYGDTIDIANEEVYSYVKSESWERTDETHMSIPMGAGAIVGNATDLNTFFYELFTSDIISESSLANMTNFVDGYGLGLLNIPFHEKTAIGHSGGIDGFQSSSYYFPEDSLNITYLSNGVSFSKNELLIGALSIYFGLDYELPSFAVVQLESEILENYIGTYACKEMPLKIEVSHRDGNLYAQATGQGEFQLEATSDTTFIFDGAGIKMVFSEAESFTLYQGGMEIEFMKE